MPRFNLAAFLIPPIWGPANGQWPGVIFLPIWLFVDSIVASAVGKGPAMAGGATLAVATTLLMQAWFGRNGYPLAWHHAGPDADPERFLRHQRAWAIAAVPLAAAFIAWATYYRLVLAP